MKTILSFATVAFALSACDIAGPATEQIALNAGRDAARATVTPIVADTVPGPAGVVLTNCIIDNASGPELLQLAAQGATPTNITLVSNILARPETVTCATTALT